MRLDLYIRLFLALGVTLGLLLVLVATFFVTESAFAVWDRLKIAPAWLLVVYATAVGCITLGSGWLIFRLLGPRKRRRKSRTPALTEAGLEARIADAQAGGIDVAQAESELSLWRQRRAAGRVQVAMFGEISAGKSSLIRALLPATPGSDEITVSVRGGSTRTSTDYRWTSPAGDELVLTDVPGLGEAGGQLDAMARDEALRAHVVVFVCDGDLTRDQLNALKQLREAGKPTLVALNKIDRYTAVELASIRQRIDTRLGPADAGSAPLGVVAISAAPHETVVRVDAQGNETEIERPVAPRVEAMKLSLQRMIDSAPEALDQLRDASVFLLASRKLDVVEAEHRQRRSQELVKSYTRKAIIGALAAVAPGADIVIQGYLGTAMVRELCALYDIKIRDVDTDRFLKQSQRHVGKAVPLLLAVAGNALKAFPGVGTVAGGLMHAVAYGLIFDALGNSLAQTLAAGGELRPGPTARLFKEKLGENLQARTREIARLALAGPRDDDDRV